MKPNAPPPEDDPLDQLLAAPADSTVRKLHAELATLADDLRLLPPPDPRQDESACRRAAELVAAVGRDTSPKTIAAAAEPDLPALGEIGPYKLLAKLGQGGMGTIYKALHTRLDKVVALKVLPTERMKSPEAVARFEREMKAVGRLEHPHIVRAVDAGEYDGVHFLVMEYVEGCDLSELSRKLGPLPVAEACELVRQAALGLEAAHEHGMVHRDIKPANLFLAQQRVGPPLVKVLDLGLALLSDIHAANAIGLTSSGQIMGTLDYMAPEQAGDTHNVDIRADVYSLGATVYKLLTGHSIYHAAQNQTLMQKLLALATLPAPPIQTRRSDLPEELAAVVHRMLEKNPSGRYSTPVEVALVLEPFAQGADLASLLERARKLRTEPAPTRKPTVHSDSLNMGTVETESHVAPQPSLQLTAPYSSQPVVMSGGRPAAGGHPDADASSSPLPAASSVRRGAGYRKRNLAAAAGLLAVVLAALGLYLSGVIFKVKTEHGTLIVEVDQPNAVVTIDGQQAKIQYSADGKTLTVTVGPGTHKLAVTTADGLTLRPGSDTFTIESGGRQVITARLQAESEPPGLSPRSDSAATWQPTLGQQQFLDAVALLPAEEQMAAVADKLKEANPGYHGKLEHTITDGRVVEVALGEGWHPELWPLAALKQLTSLEAFITPRTDPAPLATLPLEHLGGVAVSPFNDRAPALVKSFRRLKTINGVSPQAWLARKQDVEELRKILPAFSTDKQLARVVEKLKEYNPGYDGKLEHKIEGGRIVQVSLGIALVSDLSPLRALPALKDVNCRQTQVSDLSPLKGMPLTVLYCYSTPISDLSPLQGLPLKELRCYDSLVSDLLPLSGLPLERLWCDLRLFHPPDEQLLRELKTLKTINGQPAAEFWKETAAKQTASQEPAVVPKT